jgi:hypothetical protein
MSKVCYKTEAGYLSWCTRACKWEMQQHIFSLVKKLHSLTTSLKLDKQHYLHGHGGIAVESLPLRGQRRTDVILLRESLQHSIAQCRRWGRGEPANSIAAHKHRTRNASTIHRKPKLLYAYLIASSAAAAAATDAAGGAGCEARADSPLMKKSCKASSRLQFEICGMETPGITPNARSSIESARS